MKLKTTLATSLALGLLATSAAAVAAQSEESPSGTFFTGTVSFEDTDWGGSAAHGILPDTLCGPNDEPAGLVVDDISNGSLIEATDPRISGTLDEAYSQLNCFVDDESVASAYWVEYRITNDEGSWSGSGPGYIARELDWEDPRSLAYWHTMTGEGAYEGLTAVFLRERNAWNEDGPPTHVVNGVIVAGDIPPASDFEGSAEALEGLVPDPRFDFEEEGEDDGLGASGVGVILDEATQVAGELLGEDLGFGVETMPETVADFLEWNDDPDWAERMTNALDAIGVAAEDTSIHFGSFGDVGEDFDPENIDVPFQLSAMHYPGADPAALTDWFHPDNQDGPVYSEERTPGTTVDEIQFGDHLVYAAYVDGAPMYTLIEGEVTLDIWGPEGPGSYPDEAAVEAFFEALPNLAEIDDDEIMAESHFEDEFTDEAEPVEVPEALLPVESALGQVAASLDGFTPGIYPGGTLGDFLTMEAPDPGLAEMQVRLQVALDTLGIDGDAVQNYWLGLESETDSGPFWGMVDIYEGADSSLLAEVMHPDNDLWFLEPSPTDTDAEELSYGGKMVYRHWNQGMPRYILVDDNQVLVINPPNPDEAPDEAAVDAFFTALLGPADPVE